MIMIIGVFFIEVVEKSIGILFSKRIILLATDIAYRIMLSLAS